MAGLEAAAATDTLPTWLAALPTDILRWKVRRALEFDRQLWTRHPASLASCLLARTLHMPELAPLREAWHEELDARGIPWIRPLRALPVADGLLAELHGDADLDLGGLRQPRFVQDGSVLLEDIYLHPSFRGSKPRRRDRLRWKWERGETAFEPDPQADETSPQERYPRFESDGWGPQYLVRTPGQPREQLPCPKRGSADACLSADGRRLFVYGTHDEYSGGFVYILDFATLEIERQVNTDAPVSQVHECSRRNLLLLNTYRGLWVWSGERVRPLPISADEASLSPSGRYVVTFDSRLRVWLLSELLLLGNKPRNGFPSCFDPSGTRLLAGRRLSDGRTGELIAELTPAYGQYLEGGPPSPWLHFGERFLLMLHSGLRVWDTRSGAPLHIDNPLHLFSGDSLAYDRAGSRLAVLHLGNKKVELHELPAGRPLATIGFDMGGTVVAMSEDGAAIAVRAELKVEVRAASGELLGRFSHPGGAPHAQDTRHEVCTLRFSADGRRIASFLEGDGWRIWDLQGGHEEHLGSLTELESRAGLAEPRPRDWDIDADTQTLFVHRPTGTRIALPVAGPWVCNPADPQNVACYEFHAELRAL